MNKNKQRIAIAEFCGAKWYQVIGGRVLSFNTLSHMLLMPKTGGLLNIPNYPEDLNAVHEAEKVLSESMSLGVFRQNLYRIVKTTHPHMGYGRAVCHATASQRAEALLRTIGKWEED